MLADLALPSFIDIIALFADVIVAWGWILVLFLALWIAWETYQLIKNIDYLSTIEWTYYQVSVPDDSGQTPKAMENAFEVWGGIHKDPDLIEKYFEGYLLAWYSCEIQCSKGVARYIMVVPTNHSKFIEGVIYGQYPTASVVEVPDYTQEFPVDALEKDFDMYGSEVVLTRDDYYPIRLYSEFEDSLAEDDRYVDPHQALIETYTNISEGEHFWVQILVKPVSATVIGDWADSGQQRIKELSGQAKEEGPGIFKSLTGLLTQLPGEILTAFRKGPLEAEEKKKDEHKLKFYNPSEDAVMRGILQKVSRSGFKTKIRVIHIAPAGKLFKPNISKAIGAFKQFNTFHLNGLKPDSATKTNGPNYVLKQTRRRYRKRVMLLNYQWRDFFGDDSGQMFTAEELATLYHFPIKYVRAPAIERSAAGLGSPPENVPFV